MGYSSQLFDAACGARWPIEAPLLSSRLARLGAHPHAPQVARGSSNHDREAGARCTAGCRRAFYSTTRCIVVSVRVYRQPRQRLRPFTVCPRAPGAEQERGIGAALGFAGQSSGRRSSASRESRRPRSPAWHRFDRLTSYASHARPCTVPRPPDALGVRRRLDPHNAQRRGARRPSAARPARVSGVTAKCVRG